MTKMFKGEIITLTGRDHEISAGQSNNFPKMVKGEIITLTGRDLVMATHKAWAKALDSPLEMALPSKSHKVTSYYRTIDWADLLPKAWPCSADKWSGDAKEMQWFEGETNFKDRHLGIEWL